MGRQNLNSQSQAYLRQVLLKQGTREKSKKAQVSLLSGKGVEDSKLLRFLLLSRVTFVYACNLPHLNSLCLCSGVICRGIVP